MVVTRQARRDAICLGFFEALPLWALASRERPLSRGQPLRGNRWFVGHHMSEDHQPAYVSLDSYQLAIQATNTSSSLGTIRQRADYILLRWPHSTALIMPLTTMAPSRTVPVKPLSGNSFQEFGEVIEDPATHDETLAFSTIEANQGSARKVLDVSHLKNHYALSQSKKPASPTVNMFVCKPRSLEIKGGNAVFPVKVLERHPFTPQTFVPMGLDRNDKETAYLVIVAPTLPLNQRAREEGLVPPYPVSPPKPKRSLRERLLGSRPNPFTNDYVPKTTPPVTIDLSPSQRPKGPGLPDLSRVQAFIARGDQAVTYGPGTWHAPMVVLGQRPIEFVVLQYGNGVGVEDCQEVDVITPEGGRGLDVVIEDGALAASPPPKSML